MGAIAGSDLLVANFNADLPAGDAPLGQVHMFIGAMILGPLAAYIMKRLDALWDGKVKAGFEMLVNMFSAGILAFMILAIVGFFVVAPWSTRSWSVLGNAVELLVDNNLLPLTSIIIEPAKVLLPQQRHQPRRADPAGPHRGRGHRQVGAVPARGEPRRRASACCSPTRSSAAVCRRRPAPGAAIIQFFGGIHEIYFPYVLMKPRLILAMIAGGMTGSSINVVVRPGPPGAGGPGLDLRRVRPDGQG